MMCQSRAVRNPPNGEVTADEWEEKLVSRAANNAHGKGP